MVDALVEDVAIEASRRLGPFKRFMRHRLAFFGIVIIAILLVGSALAPWLAPFDPDDIDIVNRFATAPLNANILLHNSPKQLDFSRHGPSSLFLGFWKLQ